MRGKLEELDVKYEHHFFQKVRREYLSLTKKTDTQVDREIATSGEIPFGYLIIRDKR